MKLVFIETSDFRVFANHGDFSKIIVEWFRLSIAIFKKVSISEECLFFLKNKTDH